MQGTLWIEVTAKLILETRQGSTFQKHISRNELPLVWGLKNNLKKVFLTRMYTVCINITVINTE